MINNGRIKGISLLSAFVFLFMTKAFGQSSYQANIDLRNVVNDQLKVVLETPSTAEKRVYFIFPRVVPGTYENSSFGRYISEFKAFDARGKYLRVKKMDENRYTIKKAFKLSKITYLVDDTWDTASDRYIFQPGGTNFADGEEFVLNTFGFLGYLQGATAYPYEIKVRKPQTFYGATSLDKISSSAEEDVYRANNYVDLTDQPILYGKLDTISYLEGGARVHVAVYPSDSNLSAKMLMETLQPITQAASFVLGKIPTDEYWFLLHFFELSDPSFRYGSGAFGALEHNKSSLYYLPVMRLGDGKVDTAMIKSNLRNMGAHEFLHILTPLNLHSEEIAFFDFYDTKMSRHLWLYEGVTEYLSMKVQLLGGINTREEFYEDLESKISQSTRYADFPFTEMSVNILDPHYRDHYGNVYLKGAILALLLDIKIAQLTNGQSDLIDLMLDLIEDYGMNNPFKDEELFDVITAKTGPAMREFFAAYFEDNQPLPYAELLGVCGLNYTVEQEDQKYSFGPIRMNYDAESGLLNIAPGDGNNIIPKNLAIRKLNNENISFAVIRKYLTKPETGDALVIEYMEKGVAKSMVLKPELSTGNYAYKIREMEEMNYLQNKLFRKLFTPGDRE